MMNALPKPSRSTVRAADGVESAALSTSLLCLMHCLALPLLLVLLPTAADAFVRSEAFHYVAVGLAAPFALLAFALGFRRHGEVRPALFGAAGIGCLLVALFPGIDHGASIAITITGSLLLIAGHLINWRLRRHAT
ncbi:MerC domain-containing protein [Sphingopyxis sp. JAI128]|uniref:MerC domain-containing protein n=1 Tax=Sphingopyxis sp. JAI128 TaxID=2723066 RepID=UPI0016159199|nr:MerC domain-containing protein [Sphingopyxis sp. JAI128]MBB6425304.1 hypothetical protein [Sphingopyxis sp. JAI128]